MPDEVIWIFFWAIMTLAFGPLFIYMIVAAFNKMFSGLREIKKREKEMKALRDKYTSHIRGPYQ